MTFFIMNPIIWANCNTKQQRKILSRSAVSISEEIILDVRNIIDKVKFDGDGALHNYSALFDKIKVNKFRISAKKITSVKLEDKLKKAMFRSMSNINKFHVAQIQPNIDIETEPGVRCKQITRPITSVGLYIPGGSAALFSTVLMLAIPARIAGCSRIIMCSPPPISNEILYAAHLCGVREVFQIGGAQAIAALAFGTESIPKVDKIFGPGNIWVTEAKRQVSQHVNGVGIDMPAGPSELLIIADENAQPNFIASDLLSQAEHGPDSQVILLTPSILIAEAVAEAITSQLKKLPRALIVKQSLKNSHLIVTKDLAECIDISNCYGPEHLSIHTSHAANLVDNITNAGSIFLGDWSPEAAGDYASGTNHVLPTYGHTTTYSGLGLIDFQKRITVQELTPKGLKGIADTIKIMANAENLIAHKNAVSIRLDVLKD